MHYFIVNPTSSSGKGMKIWKKAEAILKAGSVEYKCLFLRAPGDAGHLAAQLTDECRPCQVTIVGGDGTINEFVSGLTHFEGLTLSCIPIGSGNDFARALGLEKDPRKAMQIILHPTTILPVRIGVATGSGKEFSRFAVSSGIGYDAAVCYVSDNSRLKKFLNAIHAGKLIYLINAVRLLLSVPRFTLRLQADDADPLCFNETIFAAAMNTCFEGGGFRFCPEADPSDDQLDIILAEGIPRLKMLFLLPTALFGRHTHYRGIHILRCHRAVIETGPAQCVHTDGEHYGFCESLTWSLTEETLPFIIR